MTYRIFDSKLIFENDFDEPIEGEILQLVSQYEEIHFGTSFSHKLDNLPSNVKKLCIGTEKDVGLDNLPETVKHLEISSEYNLPLENLPNSLETLIIGNHIIRFHEEPFPSLSNLPNSIKNLEIRIDIPIDDIPDSIENLRLGIGFKKNINRLPQNLKCLSISSTHEQSEHLKQMYPDIVQPYTCINLNKTAFIKKIKAREEKLKINH
jgi:hypothetical protein